MNDSSIMSESSPLARAAFMPLAARSQSCSLTDEDRKTVRILFLEAPRRAERGAQCGGEVCGKAAVYSGGGEGGYEVVIESPCVWSVWGNTIHILR